MRRFTTMIAAVALGWLALTAGCNDDPSPSGDGMSDAATDAAGDAAGDAGDAGPLCMGLFGAPNERTGLTDDQCRPACDDCAPSFTAPTFTAEDLDWMRTRTFAGEFAPITEDPYGAAAPSAEGVCGVLVGAEDYYALETYAGIDALEAAGAQLTHWGACGVCSTLENFAVYAGTSDLTQPVRQCGIDNASDFEGNVGCLEGLGFDLPCAQIWAYNTRNTRESCLAECIAALGADYNLPDGSLNDCLACDEAESGPVFKAVAGRSRRNSGLASAICRPCSSVQPVAHDYLPSR